jgi:hypothetical protein
MKAERREISLEEKEQNMPVNRTPLSPSKIQNNVNASWENYSGKIYEDEICKETRDSNRAIRN